MDSMSALALDLDTAAVSLLTRIAQALTMHPDAVLVKALPASTEGVTTLELSVKSADMGSVIGNQGRIARSLRTVLVAMGRTHGREYKLDIVAGALQ
jgi:uncharacterized protein